MDAERDSAPRLSPDQVGRFSVEGTAFPQALYRIDPGVRLTAGVDRLALALHLRRIVGVEAELVVPATAAIVSVRPDYLSQKLEAELTDVVVDEAHHLRAALAILNKPEVRVYDAGGVSAQIRRLCALCRRSNHTGIDESTDAIRGFAAAYVTETSISGTLASVARDSEVSWIVRQVYAEHAQDESRHQVLFHEVATAMWPHLNEEERALFCGGVATAVELYVAPDVGDITKLAAHLFAVEGKERELYMAAMVNRGIDDMPKILRNTIASARRVDSSGRVEAAIMTALSGCRVAGGAPWR